MAKFQFASIGVYVRDRRAAAQWYMEKLGAKVVSDDPEHWTTIRLGGRTTPEIHLCEKGDGPLVPEADLGETGVLLLADGDLRTVHRQLAAKGVQFVHPPEKAPWGWFAKFLDLDGNEFWLMPRPSR